MSNSTAVEVSHLTKTYRQTTTGRNVTAIERLDFEIAAGEIVAIVGQTGCGKSTFFDIMIGLDHPTEGRISIVEWLQRLGLAKFIDAYPHELSGGMRQRAAIARAFILKPSILLADEAFGHLDEVTAAELRETFVKLARECGSTALLITHQLEEAITVGERILVFARPARVLADIRVADWPASEHGRLREAIQSTLQGQPFQPRSGTA